ncbi:MAG: hypothetical protein QM658_09255 [Gordonia sp. (in: high G+C Gram-positive bacteria)]
MDSLAAVDALVRAGVELSPVQSSAGDATMVLFSALGAGVRQRVIVDLEALQEISELLDRIRIRPGSHSLKVAKQHCESLRQLATVAA